MIIGTVCHDKWNYHYCRTSPLPQMLRNDTKMAEFEGTGGGGWDRTATSIEPYGYTLIPL
jgi:hypothetical protein